VVVLQGAMILRLNYPDGVASVLRCQIDRVHFKTETSNDVSFSCVKRNESWIKFSNYKWV